MIIKKFDSVHGGIFPGAAYNEKEVKEGVAELVGHANIDGNFLHTLHTLHGVGIDCGKEVEQYMQSRSKTFGNTRSTQFQLHLALSCKGQEKNKEQLTAIAHAMMKELGAGKQPYLIYYHHDTENNHVHILTTRVTSKGRMMSDHQDFARLNHALNRVLPKDQKLDVDRMFAYSFTTEGQFMNIARGFYYKVAEDKKDKNKLLFYHGGTFAFDVPRGKVTERIAKVKNDRQDEKHRNAVAKQMKAIIIKYREKSLSQMPSSASKLAKTDKKPERAKTKKELTEKKKKLRIQPDIKKLTNADGKPLTKTEQYQMNWLIETLRNKFGIAVHFQKDKNGVVRGYGIVDHNNKVALNGSDVMKLADIVNFKQWQETQQRTTEKAKNSWSWQPSHQQEPEQPKPKARIYQPDSTLDIYRPLFKARVGSVDGKKIVRMELDGKIYDHEITVNQDQWYALSTMEAREDIAIRLAVFYFYQQIYDNYRRKLADIYVKTGSNAMSIDGENIRCVKLMNGNWCLSYDFKGSCMQYELTRDESREINKVCDNDEALKPVKAQLFKSHVVRDEVNAITRNLNYEDTKIYPSYAKDNDTKENVIGFTKQHQPLMQGLVKALSVNVSNGFNREFEVGGRRNNWDKIDDDRWYRGGLSM